MQTIDGYIAPNGDWIKEGKYFTYEVSIYKISKNRLEYYGSKYYSFNNPINIKKKAIYKKCIGYTIGKFIDWITAPKDFIIKNNLHKIDPNVRKRKRKSKL